MSCHSPSWRSVLVQSDTRGWPPLSTLARTRNFSPSGMTFGAWPPYADQSKETCVVTGQSNGAVENQREKAMRAIAGLANARIAATSTVTAAIANDLFAGR